MKLSKPAFFALSITIIALSSNIFAAEDVPAADKALEPTPMEQKPDYILNLGGGLAYRSAIYKGDDDSYMPIPSIFYAKDDFAFLGNRVMYKLYQDDAFRVDALAVWIPKGYDEDDSSFLDGMADRKSTIEAGGSMSYSDGWGKTSVSFVTDILSVHHGHELTASYSKDFNHGRQLKITPSAGIAWQSGNLTDYYYGVRDKEATAQRPEYSVGDAVNPYAMLQLNYYFNEKWSTMVMARYDWLDSQITDSPIINKHHQIKLFASVMYRF